MERQRRNQSQQMLADFAGLSLSTIRRAESGKAISADARQRICGYLAKPPEVLGLVEITVSDSQTATSREFARSNHDEESEDMNRRQVLKVLGVAGATVLIGGGGLHAAQPWEQLSRALSRHTLLDNEAIAHLEVITRHFWQIRASMPSDELLAGVVAHLHTVSTLLQDAGAEQQRVRLASIACKVALVAGQLAFDSSDTTSARSYYRAAIQAAGAANDPTLKSLCFARMGLLCLGNGDVSEALRVLDGARNLAALGGNTTVQAWVNAVVAEANASAEITSVCLHALDAAEDGLSAQVDMDSESYLTNFHRAQLASYRGVCYLHLHQTEQAITALSQSLASLESGSIRRRPRVLADMATARAQQGEVDEACRLASEALQLMAASRNLLVMPRLRRVRAALEPWKEGASIKRFDEQLLMLA